jgi:hypothetical protein
MFALVKADQVIKEIRGGPYTDEAGVQHPANIFSVWSAEELKAIGIYSVIEDHDSIDHKTESQSGKYTYTINENNVTKTFSKKDKDIDAIKEEKINSVNRIQNSILNNTDWYYIRKADKGTAIPTDIQNYRDAVRIASDKMVTDITAVTDKAGFQALYPKWVIENEGEDPTNEGGIVDIWPDPEDYNL